MKNPGKIISAAVQPNKMRDVHIWIPNILYLKAMERVKELGLKNFSEYVRHLIVSDLKSALKSARAAVEQGGGG
ncbi:MAG: hypothetical protein QXU69_03410 [Thermofilaceae archaeon]